MTENETDRVKTDSKFSRLGLDSAMVVYVMMDLEEKLDIELSTDDLYGTLSVFIGGTLNTLLVASAITRPLAGAVVHRVARSRDHNLPDAARRTDPRAPPCAGAPADADRHQLTPFRSPGAAVSAAAMSSSCSREAARPRKRPHSGVA